MLPESLSIRRTDKIVYQQGDVLLQISVPHCGSRYTQGLLEAMGCKVEGHHVGNCQLWKEEFRSRPAVVPLRDPYKCFLTWWKEEIDEDSELQSSLGCFGMWNALDSLLYTRRQFGAKTILWRVDQETEQDLADRLGLTVPNVDISRHAHFITDKYVEPVRQEFPDDLQNIAVRWGY